MNTYDKIKKEIDYKISTVEAGNFKEEVESRMIHCYQTAKNIVMKRLLDTKYQDKLKKAFPNEVFKCDLNSDTGEIMICFERCEIIDTDILTHTYGIGMTFEEACEDYYYKIIN